MYTTYKTNLFTCEICLQQTDDHTANFILFFVYPCRSIHVIITQIRHRSIGPWLHISLAVKPIDTGG